MNLISKLRPKNLLARRRFNSWYNIIEDSQWWEKEKLHDYQWDRIKILLKHAYQNTQYYKSLFNDLGALPEDIKDFNDFKKIPVLTKDILRERSKEFFPQNIKKKHAFYFTTGGSTGEPLGFYRQPVNDIIERAFMYNQWSRVGFNESSKRVILRGEPVPGNQLFVKRASNSWLFSSYHLSELNISEYVKNLNEIKPDFFHVYPSSFFIFTQLLLEAGLALNFVPKAILCGSENLYDYQRSLFEKTYNTRAFSWLGLAEQTTLAGECEHSTDLHAWPQHSFVELLNSNGCDLDNYDSSGEIIGTNLHNFVTPFIRYKSGDIGVFGGSECKSCGRKFLLIKGVEGRVQDVIYLQDNTPFPVGPAIFGIHTDFWAKVRKIQLIQETAGNLLVKLETSDPSIKSKVSELLSVRFAKKIQFQIELTNQFERTKNGKHKFLISNL